MTFGTTDLDDLDQLEDQAGPKSPILRDWADLLERILADVARLEAGLAVIKQEMAELEAAGMFRAVPTEIWEDRDNTTHSEKRYLRLSFPKGALGSGRRKLYVGCKEANILKARQMAARRRQWEKLEKERVKLDRFLRMTRGDVQRLAGSVRRYQIPEDLGLGSDVAEASAGPKEFDCEDCRFKELDPGDGWCYMFDEKQPGECAQYQTLVTAAPEWVRPGGSGAEWDVEGRVVE